MQRIEGYHVLSIRWASWPRTQGHDGKNTAARRRVTLTEQEMVNISASSTQAVLARSRHLSAIFVPAYGCVPSEFREYGPVIVAGSSPLPLVRIEGACDGE